jgi:hypothetical protein
MTKTADEIKPNFSPVYAAALYPQFAKIFQKHGYALAVHGSLANDFDLIAVPWAEKVSPPEEVLKEITKGFIFKEVNGPEKKNHGRVAYKISVGFGICGVDLSFLNEMKVLLQSEVNDAKSK